MPLLPRRTPDLFGNPTPQTAPVDLVSWLRLARTERVGPITFRQLVARYGSARAALDALPHLSKSKGQSMTIPTAAMAEDEIAATQKLGGCIMAASDPTYPEALAAIEDAPPVISLRGNLTLLTRPAIGIVGARNASLSGRKMAEILARDMGQAGYTITSGLARGIDTAAHKASLNTGTIAAVAGGVDIVYPEENAALYTSLIADGSMGLIISDQPLGTPPQARLFPRRNRLISGLSRGVVVVEAAKQSGSLITARMALEQGREVFAVPGSPLDPRCHGTNDLLRQGAIVTEGAADILAHIVATEEPRHTSRFLGMGEDDTPFGTPASLSDTTAFAPAENALSDENRAVLTEKVLENLSPCPIAVDELLRECDIYPPVLLAILLDLELSGMIERHAGNRVVRIA